MGFFRNIKQGFEPEMQNTYHKDNATDLLVLSTQIATTCGPEPESYGLTEATVTDLVEANTALDDAVSEYETLKVALRAALENRDARQSAVVSKVAAIARSIYSEAGLTPTQISATGLKVHDTVPTRSGVNTPGDLSAAPSSLGYVKLKWDRRGNKQNTVYLVQASYDGLSWETIHATPRITATLGLFPPGERRYFRILAQRAGKTSYPTPTVGIYLGSSGTEFGKLAA